LPPVISKSHSGALALVNRFFTKSQHICEDKLRYGREKADNQGNRPINYHEPQAQILPLPQA
jgi:hypothetical protein